MKQPDPAKLTAAQKRDQKAELLRAATEILSQRVGALADAVQTNNQRIAELQKEVNCKPDDEEVKLITGLAQVERRQQLKWAVSTALISSVLAATVGSYLAFLVAEHHAKEKCLTNAQNIATIVDVLEGAADPTDRLQPFIDDLKSNRNKC